MLDEVTPRVDVRRVRNVKPRDLATRFALGATVSVVAGIISHLAGARIGGVFLAFPAILPASLTIVQEKEGTRTADRDALGAVLGGSALVVFAAVAESMFRHHNSAAVLALAFAAWLVSSFAFYVVLGLVRPDKEDRHRDS